MKTIYLHILFLVISSIAFAYTTADDLTSIINSADIDDIEMKQLIPKSNAILLAQAKKASISSIYGKKVYKIYINNKNINQKKIWDLRNVLSTVNKSGLLHITITGSAEEAQFLLPEMDTVVHSDKVLGCQFFFANAQGERSLKEVAAPVTARSLLDNPHALSAPTKKRYFFILSDKIEQNNKKITISTKNNEEVFVTDPSRALLYDNKKLKPISRLYKSFGEEFFLNNTLGFSGVIKDKSLLTKENIAAKKTTTNSNSSMSASSHNEGKREPRDHQIKQILEYIIAKENKKLYLTFAAATGSGKTDTMLQLAELLKNKKILIATTRSNLVNQIVTEAKKHHPDLKIDSSNNHNESNILNFLLNYIDANNVTVTTIQGLQTGSNYKNKELLKKIDIIIFDEAHNLIAEKRKEIVDHIKQFVEKKIEMLFFTATPTYLEENAKTGLSSVYQLSDEMGSDYNITPFTIEQAIDARANTPFQIFNVTNLPALEKFTISNGEYNELQLSQILGQSNELHQIALDLYLNGSIERKSTSTNTTTKTTPIFGKQAIAFCAGIFHAEKLKDYLNSTYQKNDGLWDQLEKKYKENVHTHIFEQAITNPEKTRATLNKEVQAFLTKNPLVFADAIHGGNETYQQKDTDDRLLRNKLGGSLIVCGVSKLTEGYDNPNIEIAFMLKPVIKSNVLQLQRFGRIVRVSPNKDKVAVAFEFIYDQRQHNAKQQTRQLLLSSPSILGKMSYGLKDEKISTTFTKQLDKTEYHLSSDIISSGQKSKKQKNKRAQPELKRKREDNDDKQANKKRKITYDKNSLFGKLVNYYDRLKNFYDSYLQSATFNDTSSPSDDSESDDDNDDDNDDEKPGVARTSSSAKNNSSDLANLDRESNDYLPTIYYDAQKIMDDIDGKVTTTTDKKPKQKQNVDDKVSSVDFSPLPKADNQAQQMEKLIRRIKKALKQSESAFADTQLQALKNEFAELEQNIALDRSGKNIPQGQTTKPSISNNNMNPWPINVEPMQVDEQDELKEKSIGYFLQVMGFRIQNPPARNEVLEKLFTIEQGAKNKIGFPENHLKIRFALDKIVAQEYSDRFDEICNLALKTIKDSDKLQKFESVECFFMSKNLDEHEALINKLKDVLKTRMVRSELFTQASTSDASMLARTNAPAPKLQTFTIPPAPVISPKTVLGQNNILKPQPQNNFIKPINTPQPQVQAQPEPMIEIQLVTPKRNANLKPEQIYTFGTHRFTKPMQKIPYDDQTKPLVEGYEWRQSNKPGHPNKQALVFSFTDAQDTYKQYSKNSYIPGFTCPSFEHFWRSLVEKGLSDFAYIKEPDVFNVYVLYSNSSFDLAPSLTEVKNQLSYYEIMPVQRTKQTPSSFASNSLNSNDRDDLTTSLSNPPKSNEEKINLGTYRAPDQLLPDNLRYEESLYPYVKDCQKLIEQRLIYTHETEPNTIIFDYSYAQQYWQQHLNSNLNDFWQLLVSRTISDFYKSHSNQQISIIVKKHIYERYANQSTTSSCNPVKLVKELLRYLGFTPILPAHAMNANASNNSSSSFSTQPRNDDPIIINGANERDIIHLGMYQITQKSKPQHTNSYVPSAYIAKYQEEFRRLNEEFRRLNGNIIYQGMPSIRLSMTSAAILHRHFESPDGSINYISFNDFFLALAQSVIINFLQSYENQSFSVYITRDDKIVNSRAFTDGQTLIERMLYCLNCKKITLGNMSNPAPASYAQQNNNSPRPNPNNGTNTSSYSNTAHTPQQVASSSTITTLQPQRITTQLNHYDQKLVHLADQAVASYVQKYSFFMQDGSLNYWKEFLENHGYSEANDALFGKTFSVKLACCLIGKWGLNNFIVQLKHEFLDFSTNSSHYAHLIAEANVGIKTYGFIEQHPVLPLSHTHYENYFQEHIWPREHFGPKDNNLYVDNNNTESAPMHLNTVFKLFMRNVLFFKTPQLAKAFLEQSFNQATNPDFKKLLSDIALGDFGLILL